MRRLAHAWRLALGVVANIAIAAGAAAVPQDSAPASPVSRTAGGEPDLTGTYTTVHATDGFPCAADRRGAVVLPSVYAGDTELIQSPDYVIIRNGTQERIVPLNGKPPVETSMTKYVGEARGYWEREALVIESTGVPEKTIRALTGAVTGNAYARIVERFTRIDMDTLRYDFTLEDGIEYVRPLAITAALRRATRGRDTRERNACEERRTF